MSWVYENGKMLGEQQIIMVRADDLLTVDSKYIPGATTLGLFKGDGWEIYNSTCLKDDRDAEFKFRTTYKKVKTRARKV